MSNTAPIKWAQRSDSLFITIALPDVSSEKIELTDTNLNFTGSSGGKDYEVHIEFFKNVKASAEESKYKVTPRSVQFYVLKEKDDDEFWPRLLKDKIKEKNQVKIDWDRYVDEDEEEDEGGFDLSGMEGGMGMGGMPGGMGGGMGGMDMEALMKQMKGMGGEMPDMSGMGMAGLGGEQGDDHDDSDDDLPDLEDA